MTIQQYLDSINKRYKQGNATEHTFRGDLQQLIESLDFEIRATNEPKRQKCGAPDYILTKKDIPVGFIEAKDIGDKDLDGIKKTGNKEQFDRYKSSLSNLIFTDYLDFHLYRDGEFVAKIAIGKTHNGSIVPLAENFDTFTSLIKEFCVYVGQTIKGSKKLAQMMAGKASLLSLVIEKALTSDEVNEENSTLKEQMHAFKDILIHNITPKGFADVYAQTIAYGMFAARLHDPTLPTFSRAEAAELIPKTNPFLRKLFNYIAGPDIDDRIKWIVDSLIEIFLACNVEEILKNYGASTKTEDPIIHFYETFLTEYDPKLRIARGVWYTPAPIVNFIVRAVNDVLKLEFDLSQGLSDTSKTKIKVNLQETDKRYTNNIKTVEEEVHRVQILDPATGTGTFLAEVVKQIHNQFIGQQGIWSKYVETHLLPRLNGFELLMASYAMAHLQLDLLLTKTGYKPVKNQRLKVYLTNSLEQYNPYVGELPFAGAIADEGNQADRIKRDTPVMCVIGNPPYVTSSSNKSPWILKLIADYKKGLNERKINLDDDYIKFIRYGQYFIEKNEAGILAYISNNSFLDGITHRQMRKNLLETFDKIYIVNLHGDSNKEEVCLDGSPDENVFDIKQGVSINIFIKNGLKRKQDLGQIFHSSIQGKREDKYEMLYNNSIDNIKWTLLKGDDENHFFVPKKPTAGSDYFKGIALDKLFLNKNTGIQTKNDDLTIQFEKKGIKEIETDFLSLNIEELKSKYGIKEGTWKISNAKADLLTHKYILSDILIKPFDKRYTILNQVSNGFLGRPRFSTMRHMLGGNNYAILLSRQNKSNTIDSFFVTDTISEMKSAERTIQSYHFPLYVYPENQDQQTIDGLIERVPNLDDSILMKISKKLNLKFTDEKNHDLTTFSPIDILDYIYSILYNPTYREKYREYLKINFPIVPYPTNQESFWQLVKLGKALREIHLLQHPILTTLITNYSVDGDNVITRIHHINDRVFISNTQYFDGISEDIWNFYIGGYQPAQKWLKDRYGRTLSYEDIIHYQKIIVALTETELLMKEVDKIGFE